MSQLEQPPRFFLDRSLGRKAVPEALRADGWDLITLAEHYGMPADEQVADTVTVTCAPDTSHAFADSRRSALRIRCRRGGPVRFPPPLTRLS